jgi:hypothetical protein
MSVIPAFTIISVSYSEMEKLNVSPAFASPYDQAQVANPSRFAYRLDLIGAARHACSPYNPRFGLHL